MDEPVAVRDAVPNAVRNNRDVSRVTGSATAQRAQRAPTRKRSSVASSPAADTPTASVVTAPSLETSPEPSPSATARAMPTPAPTAAGRTPAPGTHVVTRIRIADLRIDLPVIAGDPAVYTPCAVALYLPELHQPGQGGAVYVYAHPRKGLFLPILEAVRAGRQLTGLTTELFTSDAFLYR